MRYERLSDTELQEALREQGIDDLQPRPPSGSSSPTASSAS